MKALTCAAARRHLQAYCDGELTLQDQIEVSGHLDWCLDCATSIEELRLLRASLRAGMARRPVLSREDELSFQAAVIGRMKAERAMSLPIRLRAMFDDMHLVYAGAAAAAAALVCVVVALTTFRFAMLGSPGSDLNPVPIDARVLMPRPLDQITPVTLSDDAVFALTAVVTRDGHVANLELLQREEEQPKGQAVDEAIERVMGAMSRARFEPARVDGLPVAVNMVWLVEHTTVRGELPPGGRRAGKRRIGVAGPAASRPAAA